MFFKTGFFFSTFVFYGVAIEILYIPKFNHNNPLWLSLMPHEVFTSSKIF